MILVAVMAAVMWGIGAATGAPRRARWSMIGVLLAAVILVQVTLPRGHPLREATGSEPALWLLILGFVALFWAYGRGLAAVRRRSRTAEPASGERGAEAAPPGRMTEAELERQARHIVLREIGGPGQRRLREARVLIVGAGGLGAPASLYLAASGVGTLGLIDGDTVDRSNLGRQVLFNEADIGRPKVQAAYDRLVAQNPAVALRPYHRSLTEEIAEALFEDYDLILDGSDNFATRHLVNRTAVQLGKPLIAAALTQWEGQISLYHPAAGAPCYACIFEDVPDPALVPSCAEAGVLGPLPGVIGAMMAAEAIKHLTGAGQTLAGRLAIHDALWAETRVIGIARRADCPVCGAGAQPA
ncbi:HesA/MoeB/ThiF family protein [Pseudoroseicyclus aestuarii]|uniref:Molybdopterin-synthase adenylyltransferase n=1 Tax=Pseudoroseicyclus aestuarii TaxID=1795041 RepID=A0A318SSW6_9RHOB|nr:HesA/MoeB/ThiF family protein [Pseudoroseicyclus aestuarii]PYE84803.1 molybdopterin/thiamine biosynthesis adenylyltransferase [Pseudoroseicyclus aestuarii]